MKEEGGREREMKVVQKQSEGTLEYILFHTVAHFYTYSLTSTYPLPHQPCTHSHARAK